jgi:serine phosphatase RsbU (regulator of sigma subunit)
MKKLLFFIAILFFSEISNGKKLFYIKNYNPAENNENLSSDLYCVTQTPNGLLIFGTKNGIYTFDGINTLFFPIAENNYVISCLAISDTKIYIGLTDGFACLSKQLSGKFDFSLLSKGHHSGKIYKILEHNNNIVFCSKDKLSIYTKNNQLIGEIKPLGQVSDNNYFHNVFSISNKLFIRQANKGLLQYKDNKLTLMPNGEYFQDIGIFNIRERKNYLEILSVDNGFYFYDKGKITNLPIAHLKLAKVRGAQTLIDGKLGIYTANSGIIIIDSLYNQTAHISDENGLASAKINNIIADFYGNLWTAGENGFHYIAYNSPVTLFNNKYSLPGKIHQIANHGNMLYIASSLGLYYTDDNNKFVFKKRTEINSGVWDIKKLGNLLLVGTDNGSYLIENNKIRKISENPTQYIHVSPSGNEFYCIGKKSILNYNASLKLINTIAFDNQSIESITGYAAFSSRDTTFLYISAFSSSSKAQGNIYYFKLHKQKQYFSGNIVVEDKIGEIHSFNSKIYYSTSSENYLIEHNKLVKSTGILEKHVPLQTNYVDSDYHIVVFGNKAGLYKSDILVDFNYFTAVKCQKIFSINRLKNNLYFGTDKGLYVFYADRTNKLDEAPKFTLSLVDKNNIYDFSDSVIHINLPYNQNSFSILFSSTYLNNDMPAGFLWRTLENNEEWTENSDQNTISFVNVSPGSYTFEIKAKNMNGNLSPSKRVHITILSPWYKTIYAYIVYTILSISLIILVVKLNTWRYKQQNLLLERKVNERTHELIIKNQEIENQKEEIKNANREITDSIHYAKRIQSAVLPSLDFIRGLTRDFFIYYRPKNIVSGDFYWVNKVENSIIIIAADCTGHGVSGAFMSLLGISLLNEIILEEKITFPDEIINNLRERLIKMLNSDDNKKLVRDGMDISVCTIDKKRNELFFAGANNKMFLVKATTNEIVEFKADPMPAGYYEVMHPFKLTKAEINNGDVVVLCSDGYKDQFGGPKGKKFLEKRFKELLPLICTKDTDPETILEKEFLTWKGDNEQIDDVLVLGFHINC